MSPSTRKAWIEITLGNGIKTAAKWSPSTRKAWIEIEVFASFGMSMYVAFHTEGVD